MLQKFNAESIAQQSTLQILLGIRSFFQWYWKLFTLFHPEHQHNMEEQNNGHCNHQYFSSFQSLPKLCMCKKENLHGKK